MVSATANVTGGSLVVELPDPPVPTPLPPPPSIVTQTVKGGTHAKPTSIKRDGPITVVFSSSGWLVLPPGCQMGDVFEIHSAQDDVNVFAPPSEAFIDGAEFKRGLIRKLGDTHWGAIAS